MNTNCYWWGQLSCSVCMKWCCVQGWWKCGGQGGTGPPQFFRLGGHRGAQSILITSSESVSSYSIVTWCWLTSWILNTNNKTCSPELQNLAGFTAVIMAKQLSLASWVSKRKKRVGDPEERCHVITYTQEQSGQNWIDWHCEAVYSNKWKKEERNYLEQYKWTYNFKNLLSYILIFFHSELANYKYFYWIYQQ